MKYNAIKKEPYPLCPYHFGQAIILSNARLSFSHMRIHVKESFAISYSLGVCKYSLDTKWQLSTRPSKIGQPSWQFSHVTIRRRFRTLYCFEINSVRCYHVSHPKRQQDSHQSTWMNVGFVLYGQPLNLRKYIYREIFLGTRCDICKTRWIIYNAIVSLDSK